MGIITIPSNLQLGWSKKVFAKFVNNSLNGIILLNKFFDKPLRNILQNTKMKNSFGLSQSFLEKLHMINPKIKQLRHLWIKTIKNSKTILPNLMLTASASFDLHKLYCKKIIKHTYSNTKLSDVYWRNQILFDGFNTNIFLPYPIFADDKSNKLLKWDKFGAVINTDDL